MLVASFLHARTARIIHLWAKPGSWILWPCVDHIFSLFDNVCFLCQIPHFRPEPGIKGSLARIWFDCIGGALASSRNSATITVIAALMLD